MRKKKKNGIAMLFAAVAGLLIGISLGSVYITEKYPLYINISQPSEAYGVDNTGFVPVNVSIFRNTVTIQSGCYAISFDVTDDQAFSISHAAAGTLAVRPLGHDLIRDIFENFGFEVLSARIERFDNDIYYARMFIRQGDKVLDMDVRPSDAIATALRTGDVLSINESMLTARGTNIC